jgi:hypothetical protein
MKLIKLAAAAVIAVSSFAANAGLLQIDGGAYLPVPNSNYFKADLNPQIYNIGGNLEAAQDGPLDLVFTFLGKEAGWTNTFESLSDSIGGTITTSGGSFSYSQNYTLGQLIEFTFTTGGAVVPPTVSNGTNNDGRFLVSFAVALDTVFKGVKYDAILFFDDTGGYNDDDNHDDLVIGIKATVPESSTFVLMLMGLAGLFAARRLKA